MDKLITKETKTVICETCGIIMDIYIGITRKYCNKCGTDENLIRARSINTISKKSGCTGSVTANDLRELKIKQENRCGCCGNDLHGQYQIDHFYPRTPKDGELKGSGGIDNLVLLCIKCNTKKSNKNPAVLNLQEWYFVPKGEYSEVMFSYTDISNYTPISNKSGKVFIEILQSELDDMTANEKLELYHSWKNKEH